MKTSALILLSLLALAHSNPSADQLLQNDLNTLNFALTLEQLGYAFYSSLLQTYGSSSYGNYGGAATYNYLSMIRDHEAAHIDIVASTITQFGGTPHGNCTYDFSKITSVDAFLSTATLLENICTMALDGAANVLYNKSILTAAATLATVEGRHAAFLQYVVTTYNPSANPANTRAYPFANYTEGGNGEGAYEVPLTPAEVVAAVGALGLISQCPFNLSTSYTPLTLTIDLSVNPSLNTDVTTLSANDIDTLNYALTLEHLEAAFYATYQSIFTVNDFLSVGLTSFDFNLFNLIQQHEASHVSFLTGVISSLGGTAIAACNYNFGVPTTFNDTYTREDGLLAYIAVAQVLENTGVSAYDGAINTLYNQLLIQGAATIATVEARHAAYLNYLNVSGLPTMNFTGAPFYAGGSPFPAAADNAITPNNILAIAGSFISGCPSGLPTLPTVYYLTPTNTTDTSSSSSSSTSTTASTLSSSTSTVSASTSSTTTTNMSSKNGICVVLALLSVLLAAL